ncbi:MAG: DUF1761 domain-containing protein [Bacteroidota bacterium]|jgi:hypothetical protein
MQTNIAIIALAALIPLVMGFIWYHPRVLGDTWMKVAQVTEESMKNSNMALIFGLTYLFSFFLSFSLQFLTIHQLSLVGIVAGQPDYMNPTSEAGQMVAAFLEKYGNEFRTFKHGALHGVISAITIALPILGINALFERKPRKYIFIHLGYWIITLGIMGGIICAFA